MLFQTRAEKIGSARLERGRGMKASLRTWLYWVPGKNPEGTMSRSSGNMLYLPVPGREAPTKPRPGQPTPSLLVVLLLLLLLAHFEKRMNTTMAMML